MTKNPNGLEEPKYDIVSAVEKKDDYYRIIIDGISDSRLKELFGILETYYKSKDWRERINPSNIIVEKYKSRELHSCGREGCTNLICSFDSFCSEYCLKNYVSYDEDEMR